MYDRWAFNTEIQPIVERARVERAKAVRGFIGGLFAAVARYWQKQRMIGELQALDDRLLKDIGLYRNDILRLAEEHWGEAEGELPERTAPAARPATVIALPKQPERLKRAA